LAMLKRDALTGSRHTVGFPWPPSSGRDGRDFHSAHISTVSLYFLNFYFSQILTTVQNHAHHAQLSRAAAVPPNSLRRPIVHSP
jgi:hypothetical protein